jgi:glycosyltransferase involved in cell wall biosynthesis
LIDPKRRLFTILFCGRLVSEKGVPDILAAAPSIISEAARRGFRIQWVFVGSGPWQQVLANQNRVIGKNWHSTVESATYDQMPRLYREADIFLAPSTPTKTWEEQYGMALLEAQASGLPIVTTRCGGIPENVGDAAIVVPPSDPDAIAREIISFLITPKKRGMYAARARKRAVSRHDIRVGARAVARVYERVLFQ